MNPTDELNRMLKEHGAVLIRHKRHLVYRLPSGRTFTRSKTPSDPMTPHAELTRLRHILGLRQAPKPKGERTMVERPTMPAAAAPPVPAPATAAEAKYPLKQRIEVAISSEEAIQEKLLAEAQMHERKVHMLKALLPFADEPDTERSLRGILPATEPPAPAKPAPPPEPPQQITERVQVTRQLVLAATQTFGETFTVNDVMARMTGDAMIDAEERQRVRSSIAQAMISLLDRGELIRVAGGFGKRQAIWRKAALNGDRNGNGNGN